MDLHSNQELIWNDDSGFYSLNMRESFDENNIASISIVQQYLPVLKKI